MKFFMFIFLLLDLAFSKEVKNIVVESSSAVVNISSEEAKNLALRRARSMIIENANGVNVVSSVLVKDGALAAEFIKNYSSGIILNEKIEWLPITQYQKNTSTAPVPEYNVRVTADVLLKEKNSDLVLKSSIDKTIYQDNEKFKINILTSKEANLAIFFLGYDDKIYKLLPDVSKNITIKENTEIQIPRKGIDTFDLEVVVPEKLKEVTEALWIIAAKQDENIPFNIYFNKDEYSLNEFFSIYSKISDKCVEELHPYNVYKNK